LTSAISFCFYYLTLYPGGKKRDDYLINSAKTSNYETKPSIMKQIFFTVVIVTITMVCC